MGLQRRLLVNILEIKEIEFMGKEMIPVKKIKYTFLTPDQEIIYGYLDARRTEWEDKTITTELFVQSQSVETQWNGRIWEGQKKWVLV